ncbi:type II toxin-antitoxin system HicA family toxin [Sphingomonas sp. SRS2]|uniref:type II toxin-antitoxin system HicA family toxin n=1 Tax=Sphingomonas sp. SRS2 TaxID=133190 RepID=UPI0006183FFA|nr:type II toxin-antitoxin system HicA family toxin [Sphingomonas sp. SRS2]KKC27144.1 periplasmic or secreted lipoprotein [Sphingomonas sp. SRS2]
MERDTKKIIKQLKREGWELKSVSGAHHKFTRNGKVIIVSHPNRDLPIGTARQIAKEAGWL